MRILTILTAACLAVFQPHATIAGGPTSDVRAVPGWEAVGRLNIGNRNMCTGALIAPDLVLTAAHCLFDPRNGKAVKPNSIKFEAGLHHGQSKATRRVAEAHLHSDYRYRHKGTAQIGYDIALLKLDAPIDSAQIRPFATDASPERGDMLGVISYTQLQANSPILQTPCHVLARKNDTLVMNCEVEFGASGSPVFAVVGGERPRLVSVISAKAEMGNRPVSVGTIVDSALRALIQRAG